MIEIQSPNKLDREIDLFLGGAIDGGKVNWQAEALEYLKDLDIVIANPRIGEWTSKESINDPGFIKQLDWEIEAQDKAKNLLYYFHADCKCPITLFEFGKYINSGKKIIVVCPDEFWKSANVQYYCRRYHIECFKDLEHGLSSFSKNEINYFNDYDPYNNGFYYK